MLGWLGNSSTPTNISLHRSGRKALLPDLAMLVTAWLRVMPEDSRSNLPIPRAVTLLCLHFPPGELPKPTATSQLVPVQPGHLPAADLTASSGLQWQRDHFNVLREESLGFSCQQQDRKWQLVKSHALKHCQVGRSPAQHTPGSPSPGRRSQLGNAAAPEALDRRRAACRNQNPQKTLDLQHHSQEAGPQQSCTKNSVELTHCMRSAQHQPLPLPSGTPGIRPKCHTLYHGAGGLQLGHGTSPTC